jgi:hypothetical protein
VEPTSAHLLRRHHHATDDQERHQGRSRLSQVEETIIDFDFAHLKEQLPMRRVLDHLGLSEGLRGSGAQRRCACPRQIHANSGLT